MVMFAVVMFLVGEIRIWGEPVGAAVSDGLRMRVQGFHKIDAREQYSIRAYLWSCNLRIWNSRTRMLVRVSTVHTLR